MAQTNIPWSTFFSFSCWHLWKNQNKRVICNEKPDLSFRLIFKLSIEFISASSLTIATLEEPYLKLNVDGSYNRNNHQSGISGVLDFGILERAVKQLQ